MYLIIYLRCTVICHLCILIKANGAGRCPRLAAANIALDEFTMLIFIDPSIDRQTNALITNPNAKENLAPNVTATASEDKISVGLSNKKYDKFAKIYIAVTFNMDVTAAPNIFLLSGSFISSAMSQVASYPLYAQNAAIIADTYAFGLVFVPMKIFSEDMLNHAMSLRNPGITRQDIPKPMITRRIITKKRYV